MQITTFQTLALLFLSFISVGTFTPLMRNLAFKIDFMDYPNSSHKSHTEKTPYLGGVAIILGIIFVTFGALFSQGNLRGNAWTAITLFLPALTLGIVGLIDDRKALHPFPRFVAQTAVGIFTSFVIISTDTVGNPSRNSLLDAVITIVWIVGIINSINFFDNLDGGAAGAVAATSLGLALITYASGQYLLCATSISVLGAVLGFLIWNRNPAKIYMGDAGSLFLGTILSVLTIRLNPRVDSQIVSFSIPILLLAVPVLDTSVAVLSRIRRGVSIFQGGQDHLSHRLIRNGYSKRQTAFRLWLLCLVFVAFAVMLASNSAMSNALIIGALTLWIVLLVTFLRISDD